MTAQVLNPDDAARAAIHDEVGPFVDEGDVVEWRLREYGGERQNPDEDYAADRKRILFYFEHLTLNFNFGAKVRKSLEFSV